MKFWSNTSITKLVFLLIITCLCIFTGYYVFADIEDKAGIIVAFLSISLTITNYYFKDKKEKDYPDTLIKKDLDSDKGENGTVL